MSMVQVKYTTQRDGLTSTWLSSGIRKKQDNFLLKLNSLILSGPKYIPPKPEHSKQNWL